MSKTTVDIDPELLAAAKARLGTHTIKETINAALSEIAQRGEREEAIDDLANMINDGELDWDVLDDKSEYRPAPNTPPDREDEVSEAHSQSAMSSAEVENLRKVFSESYSHYAETASRQRNVNLARPWRVRLPSVVTGTAAQVAIELKGSTDFPGFDIRLPSLLGSLDLPVLTDLRDRLGAIHWKIALHQADDESLVAVDEARLLLDELVVAATAATQAQADVEAGGDAE
ncbi:type II toxin-antitoxin system VapB family antitoxin [Streptomyces clavifer]|uniref:type II toxin-antitoxin system VapB family antitoxin n=1 Tax=Streptomyces clavifer TaxID=68188 RepID=UPI00331D47D2